MPSRPAAAPVAAFIVIGVVAGLFSGFFGVGGGIIMVPLLMLVFRMDQRKASITSLVAIIPTAMSAAITFVASGNVPWDQVGFGLILAVGSTITAPLGSWALRTWKVTVVRWIFIGVLVAAAISVFLTFPDRGIHLEWTALSVIALIALGAVMGFVAGLLGVGGGIIVVPALIVGFGVSDLTAKALSLIAMVPAAVSGTVGSARAGAVDWRSGIGVGVAAAVSSPVGVWLATIAPVSWAQPLLAALLVYAAIQLAFRAYRQGGKS